MLSSQIVWSFFNRLKMAHLTHKLPWATLADVVPLNDKKRWDPKVREPFLAKKRHLAGCLSDAIAEFAARDRRSEADRKPYDVDTWDYHLDGDLEFWISHIVRGPIGSVIWGYMQLNLLAADEARLRPVIYPDDYIPLRNNNRTPHYCHETLPNWLNEKVLPLLSKDGSPLPLQTAEAMQRVYDYCVQLFRIMYTRPDIFTREKVFEFVERFLYD